MWGKQAIFVYNIWINLNLLWFQEVKKYHQSYSIDVLQRKIPPDGVDVKHKEVPQELI